MFPFIIFKRVVTPQIDKGSGDLESLTSTGEPALPNGLGLAPSGMLTHGVIYAEQYVGGASWDVAEYMVTFPAPGQPPLPFSSDRRHPPEFVLRMRDAASRFATLQDFQTAVRGLRQARGSALPCVEALGRRYADLQTSGLPDANQGVETRDLYASSGLTVGCAFIARTSATTTIQHWVMFDSRPFDDIRCARREQSYASVEAFLSAMQQLRDGSPVAFRHAYEEATHFNDVPWSA